MLGSFGVETNKIMEKKENLYQQRNNLNKEKKISEEKERVKKRGINILVIALILIVIGFANFYSAILRFNDEIVLSKITKHLMIIVLSLFSLIFSSKILNFKLFARKDIRLISMLLGFLVFLIVAFFPNSTIFPTVNGGKGWIRIGPMSLQVTELFKILYIIIVANIFSRNKENKIEKSYWTEFVYVIAYSLILFFVITVFLKDFGTTLHYVMILIFIIFMTDISDKIIWSGIGGVFSLTSLFVFLFYKFGNASSYMHHRLKIFIDGILENKYDRFEAFQIYQSLVGFGTGGILGKGYGNGVQKYSYIPEVETDFAISTFGEEMGLVGMFLILITFFILFILIMNVGENSKTYFGKYLAIGIAGYLITQVIINIGVAIGLIPVLGIPLPFISSGGSSLLTLSIAIGIVININNSKLKDL